MINRDFMWLTIDRSPIARARKIMNDACAQFGGTPAEIRSGRRCHDQTRRMVVLGIAEQIPEWTFPQIGRFLNRDPSSIGQFIRRHSPRAKA